MEKEAPSRRSVAELAGKFKGLAPPHDAAGNQTETPVRRRPPRTLQLPKTQAEDQEPLGVTSPLPAKAKRNSALIEKLQANLVLSPSALLPSPKSPGFRLLPPAFPLCSPSASPVTTVTTSSTTTPTSPIATSLLTEEEGPASFEAPPIVGEGSILSNDNIKSRARHSIRRRPPSRRLKKSSSGDEVSLANEGENLSLSSTTEPEDKTAAGEGGQQEGGEEVFKQEDQTDTSTCPEENKPHEEDHSEVSAEPREESEKMKDEDESTGEKEGADSSLGRKEEKEEEEEEEKEEKAQEKNSDEKPKEDSTEGATNTDSQKEEEVKETTDQCSVR